MLKEKESLDNVIIGLDLGAIQIIRDTLGGRGWGVYKNDT